MAIRTCIITGNVKNLLGSNVVGATLRVSTIAPFVHSGGPSFIAGEIASVTTDASGNFSVPVIETATPGVKLSFTLEYYDGLSAKKSKTYAVVVPNTGTAELSSLLSAAAAVAGVVTFPGSSVTIVPNGSLASSDAQSALYELQGDIDAIKTLPTGKIYIGDGSNQISEVTPSGDVTINSSGVTAIGAGVITNSHVNASAAIAYSKLALASSIVNADIASGAAIAYSKLALSGSIVNTDIASGAAIAYSKLSLTGSIVNADIGASAAIAYSKLALAGSIVNADIASGAAIAYSKLALTGSIVNADIGASAAIAYSKLSLANSIVNADIATGAAIAYSKLALGASIVNADIASGAAIAYSKLNLGTSIVNGDIATAAAIARSKIATGTNNHVVINDGGGNLSSEANLAVTRGGTGLGTLTANNLLVGAGTGNVGFVAPGAANTYLISNGTTFSSTTGPRAMVRCNTSNGYGSTNNKIRRFVNNSVTGSDIIYADSAVNGATFTIATGGDGVYAIAYYDNFSAAGNDMGISLNSAALTTSIFSINTTDRLAMATTSGASASASCSATVILAAGDVIRAHTGGATAGTAAAAGFSITKVSH